MTAKSKRSKAIISLQSNLDEVIRLLKIHAYISGSGPGRKFDVEVLNKSAIVLTCAAWESFNEDIIRETIVFMKTKCKSPDKLPALLRKELATKLKENKHELAIWNLAGNGWKEAIAISANEKLEKRLNTFHTPRPAALKELYKETLGIEDITSNWYWSKTSITRCVKRIDDFITLRGEIVHRVKTAAAVTKVTAARFADLIIRAAHKIQTALSDLLGESTGQKPWGEYKMKRTARERAKRKIPKKRTP